jgi:hypothetical protein
MLRTHRNAALGALVVLALAAASHRVAAQDTSSAGQAPQDTSAYTGGGSRDTIDTTFRTGVEQVDTTARPAQGAGMSDTAAVADTTAIHQAGPSTDSSETSTNPAGVPEPTAKPRASSDSTSP